MDRSAKEDKITRHPEGVGQVLAVVAADRQEVIVTVVVVQNHIVIRNIEETSEDQLTSKYYKKIDEFS